MNYQKGVIVLNKITLNESLLIHLQQQWLEEAEEASFDQQRLFLIESNFTHIISNKLYGNYATRTNQSTFLGIQEESGQIIAIVEVIKAKLGSEITLKLMSLDLSPAIEILNKEDYDLSNAKVLASCVATFLAESVNSGCTKIFARNDSTLEYLTKLHEGLTATSQALDELNLTVEFEGPRWLAFRFKN